MLFKSSAHILLIGLGIVVFAVVVGLAIDIGLFDAIFSTGAKATLDEWIAQLRNVYKIRGYHIELAVKVLGLAFTAVFGVLGFLKGWHYAEVNLPGRLVELIERLKRRDLHDRILLLAPYATRNLKGDQIPIPFGETTYFRLLRVFGFHPRGRLWARTSFVSHGRIARACSASVIAGAGAASSVWCILSPDGSCEVMKSSAASSSCGTANTMRPKPHA